MAESKKSKKAGRSKVRCQVYASSGRREINKAKRLLRHLARCDRIGTSDPTAQAALDKLASTYVRRAKRERNPELVSADAA